MSENGVNTLTEMGFLRNRAEKAWAVVGHRGVEAAMEWLLQHNEDPDIDEPYQPPQGHSLKSEGSADCPEDDVKESSIPQHPEETKELSAEEKAAQVQKLQEKINQRRLEKEELDKKREIEMEKSRRKDGKDLSKIRTEIQWKEAQRQAEIRKREKREDALARQRVKEQIARDRAEKKAREESDKMEKNERLVSSEAQSPQTTKPTAPAVQHTHARLQIRLPNGSQMIQKFSANEELSAVRLYIELNRNDGCADPFSLMTTFPKKVFTDEDYGKSLKMLGLTPSSVLIVTKSR